ncbi:MAG: prefoldin subunit beta [Candidatus Methanomethylophilaceae archaeon]|nr:prefoldin subunit beta [Candidatus Methanomethylophilaceae archaeon]
MNGISPQLQNQITQFQQVQQQLQAVSAQKAQMDGQMRELVRTKEELDKSSGTVYKTAGALLIKVDDVDALKADIDESIEMMGVRINSLERQENSLKERYTVLQETINAAMGNMPMQ